MKAILEFNLPEEDEDHRHALNGQFYHSAIQSHLEELRKMLKYGHTFKTADEVIEHMRKHLQSECEAL